MRFLTILLLLRPGVHVESHVLPGKKKPGVKLHFIQPGKPTQNAFDKVLVTAAGMEKRPARRSIDLIMNPRSAPFRLSTIDRLIDTARGLCRWIAVHSQARSESDRRFTLACASTRITLVRDRLHEHRAYLDLLS